MKISPVITLYGNCKKAIEFYNNVFGLKNIKVVTFEDVKELFGGRLTSKYKDFIYRAELNINNDNSIFTIIMCDSPSLIFSSSIDGNKDNITFEISDTNEEKIKKIYNGLLCGGKINIALTEKENYKLFGSLIDKFGICWILTCC